MLGRRNPIVAGSSSSPSLGLIAALFAATLAPSMLAAARLSASRPEEPVPKAKLSTQHITFETNEKVPVTIVGSYTPPAAVSPGQRAPMVILLHMQGADRAAFGPLVPALRQAGFAVLAIDLRGHGESVEPASLKLHSKVEEGDSRVFRDMVNDVDAAYRWMARRPEVDPARFVLVGAGLGAGVALEYAARDKSVDALVLMAPGSDPSGLDARAAARKVEARKMLLLTCAEERQAADEIGRLVPGAQTRIVPGSADRVGGKTEADRPTQCGTYMLEQAAGVQKAIADFLVEAAGAASESIVVASTKGEVYYPPDSSQAQRLSPDNLRSFSTPAEAEARGYRPQKRRAK